MYAGSALIGVVAAAVAIPVFALGGGGGGGGSATEPAQRARRRTGVAGRDPAHRRVRRGAGAGLDRGGARELCGEELLFRGFLLPRMNGACGRGDWVANGLLVAAYHLHVPWAIPGTLLEMFTTAYPTKRYRSAWIGIAVHSAQSVFLALLILRLVV